MDTSGHAPLLSSLLTPAVLAAVAAGGAAPPYPVAGHPAWGAVDPDTARLLREDASRTVAEGWPTTTLSQWLDFSRTGSRQTYERPYLARRRGLAAVALGLALDPAAPGAEDYLVDGLWSLCEETSWCLPAHDTPPGGELRPVPVPEDPVVDLYAAETAATVGWVLHLHRERLATVPGLVQRLSGEVRSRVLEPFRLRARDCFWFGLGSNWNPWITSNVVAATLLTPPPPEEGAEVLGLVVESLDRYLDACPQDGGCPEGIDYWWQSAARLFEALELLGTRAPEPVARVLAEPLLRRLARYPLAVALGPRWRAVFGDGWARPPVPGSGLVKDEHPAELLHRIGRAVGDAELQQHALVQRDGGPRLRPPTSLHRSLAALHDPDWPSTSTAPAGSRPRPTLWFPEVQVLSAATAAPGSLHLVAKGGHNDEPHNHLDVGSYVLARHGAPVVLDPGCGTYTATSFTARRYEQWYTSSGAHGVPEVGGHGQQPGPQHRAGTVAVRPDPDDWFLELELAAAYPAAAGLLSWRRSFQPDGEALVVTERWRLQDPGPVRVPLLLAQAPVACADSGWELLAAGSERPSVRLTVPPGSAVELEEVPLVDPPLVAVWGSSLHRLSLVVEQASGEGALSLRYTPLDRK